MTEALIIVSAAAAAAIVSLAVLVSHLRDIGAVLRDHVRELERDAAADRERIHELEQRAEAESLVGRTVVINTMAKVDDQTWRGIVHAQHTDRWTLRDVVSVTPVGDRAVGHLVHVPVPNLASVQEIKA